MRSNCGRKRFDETRFRKGHSEIEYYWRNVLLLVRNTSATKFVVATFVIIVVILLLIILLNLWNIKTYFYLLYINSIHNDNHIKLDLSFIELNFQLSLEKTSKYNDTSSKSKQTNMNRYARVQDILVDQYQQQLKSITMETNVNNNMKPVYLS